ncbi:MAG: hypothetical protein K5930_01300 [Treponemataceae bacterium]|nr:hypothetical protein [Treponemataceae bacterium]
MAVFENVGIILLSYLGISLFIAIYDACFVFYKVYQDFKEGKFDDTPFLGTLEIIFYPSIFIFSGIFFLIRKIFGIEVDDK